MMFKHENDFSDTEMQVLDQSYKMGFTILDDFYEYYGKNMAIGMILLGIIFIFFTTFELYASSKKQYQRLRNLHSRLDYIQKALENHKKNVNNRLQKMSNKLRNLKQKPQESHTFARLEEKLCEHATILQQTRNEMKQIFEAMKSKFPRTNLEVSQISFKEDNLLNCLDNIEEILNVANRKADMKSPHLVFL